MANRENKRRARAWRMQHRREVRQRSAGDHVRAAVVYAGVAARRGVEHPLAIDLRRTAAIRMAFNAAEAALKLAISMGDDQPALREFNDYEEDV